MSRRSLKALGQLLVVAVLAALLGGPPAEARWPKPAPALKIVVTAKPSGHNHFNSSAKVDVPPGGTATVTSPTIAADQRSARVEVDAPALSDHKGFATMAFVMMQAGSPGKRVQVCLTMTAKSLVQNDEDSVDYGQAQAQSGNKALVRIYYCLRLAQLVAEVLAEQGTPSRQLAASGCGVAPLVAPTSLTESAGQYTLSATGPLEEKPKKSKINVRCSATADGYAYKVTPRKKGASLRSAVGPTLSIGIASPTGAESGATVRVTFKAP